MRTIATVRRGACLVAIALFSLPDRAEAQVASRDFFTEPSLILTGTGHHAPVRSLIFTSEDGSRLISGGMDKVIHAWELDADRPDPSRTLRPPLWRGYRGQVAAMALSPVAGADGQRYLAVAGQGILGTGGEILLFRYPGIAGQGTGEVIAQLPATTPDGTIGPGHADTVGTLAFSPDGRYLASGSNDKTVRIWDLATLRQVAKLDQATGPINGVAYFARGTRLVAGGDDGIIRTYDVTDPARVRKFGEAPPRTIKPTDPIAPQIRTLAVSPADDRTLIVGTEGGLLLRYDAINLGEPVSMPRDTSGPLESLAISRDGRNLATISVVKNIANGAVLPDVTCVVQLRSMPDGAILERVATTANLAYALAFSPNNRFLAYSGGDAQAVFVKDLTQPAAAVVERRGPGSSLWDVGFRLDGQAIRFARARPAIPGQGPEYEAFDLRARRPINPDPGPAGYRHATATEAGWTIRPTGLYQLQFLNAQNQGWVGNLDPLTERRWWSYTIIPPNAAAGHPSPIAAVGCETGVAMWNLDTGQPTRFLNGHAGPVYALASSPDGRWLVTGSSDQTVRLWPLRDADKPAKFGARFAPEAGGGWIVNDVTPGGFADGIGLRPGMTIVTFYIGADVIPPADYANTLLKLDELSATRFYAFEARQGPAGPLIRVGSTKRDYPALNLFAGEDREWILWTPRGYYDTSVMGDRRYLGWLTNRGTVALLQAGVFDTIDKFEPKYRQRKAPLPNVIDRLLDTADPVAALAALPPANPLDADPTNSRAIELTIRPVAPAPLDRPVVVQQPTIRVNYRALAAVGAARVSRLWVEVNGRRAVEIPVAAPVVEVANQVDVPIGPGPDQRATLVMEDERGVRRRQDLSIANQSPPAPRKGRLEALAIGAEAFSDQRFPGIPFAERDAEDLAKYLRDRLVDPATSARFPIDRARVRTLVNSQATSSAVVAALDDWRKAAKDGQFAADDVVAIVVESHYLQLNSRRLLATTEAAEGDPASISADDLAARLLELTSLGCRVVVMVDAVHGLKRDGWDVEIKEWVRLLQSRSHVAVFLASEHDASRPGTANHRVFADGILDAHKPKNASRLRKGTGPLSLFDFQRTVIDAVLRDSERLQRPQFFMPDTFPIGVPFLDPK